LVRQGLGGKHTWLLFYSKNWMWIVSNLSKKRGTMQWLETQQTRQILSCNLVRQGVGSIFAQEKHQDWVEKYKDLTTQCKGNGW
jgi:hypothetical protein